MTAQRKRMTAHGENGNRAARAAADKQVWMEPGLGCNEVGRRASFRQPLWCKLCCTAVRRGMICIQCHFFVHRASEHATNCVAFHEQFAVKMVHRFIC